MKNTELFRAFCPNSYNPLNLINLSNLPESPTQQALAVEYAKMGWAIFPCDTNKAPIVDDALGFSHGFRDATTDLKLIARTWHKYPNAGIGLAIPEDLVIIDCDVRKDAEKRPVLKNGLPDMIGLKSFQDLVNQLNITGADLDTLSVKTQSGGRHFFHKMPEGISSFNHVAALPGLDLKGYGGYVILPNSVGEYGEYEFLNMTYIRPIPEALLKWVMQLKGQNVANARTSQVQQVVDDPRVSEFVNEIMPAWNSAIREHLGNEMRLAIAGTLYHYGWPESKAKQVMRLIIEKSEVQGLSEKNVVNYTYKNGAAGKSVYGFSTLEKLINKLEGDENEN